MDRQKLANLKHCVKFHLTICRILKIAPGWRAARVAENWRERVVFSGLTDTAFVYIMSLPRKVFFHAGARVTPDDLNPGGMSIDRQRQNAYMYQNITANAQHAAQKRYVYLLGPCAGGRRKNPAHRAGHNNSNMKEPGRTK